MKSARGGSHDECASPDYCGDQARHLRRTLSGDGRGFRDPGGRRQRDRCRLRRRHRARRGAAGIVNCRRASRRSSSAWPRSAWRRSPGSGTGRGRCRPTSSCASTAARSRSGVLRTVVPAAPDAWITALERHGTMSFGEVAAVGDPFRPRRVAVVPADVARQRWRRRPRLRAVPVQRRDLSCRAAGRRSWARSSCRRTSANTLQYMADQERAAASRGRKPGWRRRATRSIAATSPARSCASSKAEGRLPVRRRSRELPLEDRAGRCAAALARPRGLSPAAHGARDRR